MGYLGSRQYRLALVLDQRRCRRLRERGAIRTCRHFRFRQRHLGRTYVVPILGRSLPSQHRPNLLNHLRSKLLPSPLHPHPLTPHQVAISLRRLPFSTTTKTLPPTFPNPTQMTTAKPCDHSESFDFLGAGERSSPTKPSPNTPLRALTVEVSHPPSRRS